VDGYSTRYCYDSPHVIAEYDGNNNLLRKYIYGPGIDQPVCMIEVADSNTYYYHFDGLGSVVALSDTNGDTVQTYEYSVYGQVAAEDTNHPNPYMFAGRRFDIETGLYYNRARYYNPRIGRFLQTDPVGYGDGMNLYAYCGNNPLGRVDPSGLYWTFLDSWYVDLYFSKHSGLCVFAWVDDSDEDWIEPDPDSVDILWTGTGLDAWYSWAPAYFLKKEGYAAGWVMEDQVGYALSRTFRGRGRFPEAEEKKDWFFWRLQAMRFLSYDVELFIASVEQLKQTSNFDLKVRDNRSRHPKTGDRNWTVKVETTIWVNWDTSWTGSILAPIPTLVTLTHELVHAKQYLLHGTLPAERAARENPAIQLENRMRLAFYHKVPGYLHLTERDYF